jgi:hypothetical protein
MEKNTAPANKTMHARSAKNFLVRFTSFAPFGMGMVRRYSANPSYYSTVKSEKQQSVSEKPRFFLKIFCFLTEFWQVAAGWG